MKELQIIEFSEKHLISEGKAYSILTFFNENYKESSYEIISIIDSVVKNSPQTIDDFFSYCFLMNNYDPKRNYLRVEAEISVAWSLIGCKAEFIAEKMQNAINRINDRS